MIRQMKHGEEGKVRTLYAKLSCEDQTYWRKQTKPIEEYLAEASKIPIGEEIKGKNVILVAEEDGKIIGFCWCTIVDRGVGKQAEIAEFFVEKKYRGKRTGRELLTAAKQLFLGEKVEVAFVWTHRGNKAAKPLQECRVQGSRPVGYGFCPLKQNLTCAVRKQELEFGMCARVKIL